MIFKVYSNYLFLFKVFFYFVYNLNFMNKEVQTHFSSWSFCQLPKKKKEKENSVRDESNKE